MLLTVCGGALRRYLAERALLPRQPLVANVPVSVRATSQRDYGNNKVSILFVRLATDVDDHLERLQRVHGEATSAKQHVTALGPDTLHDWAEIGVSPLAGRVRRAASDLKLMDRGSRVAHNLTISNIPGPPGPLTFLGGKLEEVYPLGPSWTGRDSTSQGCRSTARCTSVCTAVESRSLTSRRWPTTSSRSWPSCWSRSAREPERRGGP